MKLNQQEPKRPLTICIVKYCQLGQGKLKVKKVLDVKSNFKKLTIWNFSWEDNSGDDKNLTFIWWISCFVSVLNLCNSDFNFSFSSWE